MLRQSIFHSLTMDKIPITHLIIYGELRKKGNGSRVVSISEIRPIIKWRVRIPQRYQFMIIEELISFGLMKKLGRDSYELLSCSRKSPVDSLGEPFW